MKPAELTMHILSGLKKSVLGAGTIVVLLVASTQVKADIEVSGVRSHIDMNGTWIQPFIPLNWLKLPFGSPTGATTKKLPKRPLLPKSVGR
jgi:hypothetical protein